VRATRKSEALGRSCDRGREVDRRQGLRGRETGVSMGMTGTAGRETKSGCQPMKSPARPVPALLPLFFLADCKAADERAVDE
jgi:hypothetical protein